MATSKKPENCQCWRGCGGNWSPCALWVGKWHGAASAENRAQGPGKIKRRITICTAILLGMCPPKQGHKRIICTHVHSRVIPATLVSTDRGADKVRSLPPLECDSAFATRQLCARHPPWMSSEDMVSSEESGRPLEHPHRRGPLPRGRRRSPVVETGCGMGAPGAGALVLPGGSLHFGR